MKSEVLALRPARSIERYNRQAVRCPISGKRSYRTKRKAQRITEKTKATGSNMFVYSCRHCGLWHLTSSRPWAKVAA